MFQLNVRNGHFYAVSISPRSEVQIGSLHLVSNGKEILVDAEAAVVEPSQVLLNYSFWISVVSKLTSKTKLFDKLRLFILQFC